ncbi:MAG: SprB repeat-containing protein, partial [Bacteroidetes bacterium]|nr:SprB repeat-containing protein [Bacteroidota bacterium]
MELVQDLVAVVDSVRNVRCNGGATGAVFITVTNGTLPYSSIYGLTEHLSGSYQCCFRHLYSYSNRFHGLYIYYFCYHHSTCSIK